MSAIDAQTRCEIIDVYNAYAEGIDSRNWGLVRSCFCDEVYIDYGEISAATASPDTPLRADDWMRYLQGVINGFDFTRHMISNHRFSGEGEDITCRAYLSADHVILQQPEVAVAGSNELTTVVGEYTNSHRLTEAGWKIYRSQLVCHWSTGNVGLFPEAMARAAKA